MTPYQRGVWGWWLMVRAIRLAWALVAMAAGALLVAVYQWLRG